MEIIDWDSINYQSSMDKQLELVQSSAENKNDYLVFCYHPAVVTLGRGTQVDDVFDWSGELIEVSRGGRATYHGPSQQVIYPILNLSEKHQGLATKDINAYLRFLEEVIVRSLHALDIRAEARTVESLDDEGNKLQLTGVWVADKKIASIGVAIKKWVSYHGISINLYKDEEAFKGINPCGFKSNIMTSVEEVLGNKIPRQDFIELFTQKFNEALG